MREKIVWSDKALYDLKDAFDFLSSKSQRAAERMVEKIIKKIEILDELPYLGAIETRLLTKHKIYRFLVVGNHKIIYREAYMDFKNFRHKTKSRSSESVIGPS